MMSAKPLAMMVKKITGVTVMSALALSLWFSNVTPALAAADNEPAADAQTLQAFHASYRVTRGGSEYGDAQRELQRQGKELWRYRTLTDISWFILSDKREFTSSFVVRDGAVINREFAYKRTGTGSDKAFSARFDEQQQQIINLADQQPLDIPWQVPMMDESSMLHQLKLDLLNGEQQRFEYQAIDDKGRLDHFTFVRDGVENLNLPYGKVDAILIKRIRENSSRETHYWFAPSLNYVLVKLRQWKDGDEQATLELVDYQQQ
ncbi:DUF3108 domain-containing protein [Idiomarina xiamenensis]|nr:DUF3108 domain-containing protein [Idiomarina xiamenensis]